MANNTRKQKHIQDKRKPVLLFVMPRFVFGGAEMMVYKYAVHFSKQYDVHVASTVDGGDLASLFAKHKEISVHVCSRRKDGGRIGAYRKLCAYAQDIQPDIIHSHLFGGDIVVSQLMRHLKHKPLWISTLHNVQYHQSRLRRWIWKRVFRHVDFVVAVSDRVTQYAQEHFGLHAPQLVTILNGIDLGPWLKVRRGKHVQDPVQIATIGRLEAQKGHRYLLTALSYIDRHLWELHVYGEGRLRTSLETQAQELGIASRITWHGVCDTLPTQIETIDMVVQPSLWEGLSLVVMEMMAAGKPVIATVPAGEELIEHKKTGYIVPAGQGVLLSDMIHDIIMHPEEALDVGRVARQYAKDHFSFASHVAQVERLYADVL